MNKKGTFFAHIFIVIICVFAIIYFGHKKEGYHVDELYSYGLSNSEYLPFMHFGVSGYDVKDWMLEYGAGENFGDLFSNLIKDFHILKAAGFDFYNTEIYRAYCIAQANSADTYTSTWVPGQDYVDYLAVSDSNTFNYASVYYNQRGDVHPPLFYMLLHTICSMFQGVFSKWFGIGLNIAISVLSLLVLYRMCVKHFGEERLAIVILITYAFSCGFITTALFIRMYALLTLMTLLCCYAHLELQRNNFEMTRKIGIGLFLSVLGGYYTQYYFVLYAIGIAVVMVVNLIYRHKWKSLIKYISVLISAAAVGIVIWPFSLKHVFSGYRGRASLQVFKEGNFVLYKAEAMLNNIWGNMFGGKGGIFLGIMVVSALICILMKKKIFYGKVCLIVLPIVGYALIVGQISPFLADRYVMCTYPFWCIFFIGVVYTAGTCLLERVCKKECLVSNLNRLKTAVLVFSGLLLVCSNNFVTHTPGYMFPGGQETYELPENTDCLYVLPNGTWNESAEYTNILAKCNRVGIVYESNLELLSEDYGKEAGDYLVVMIGSGLDDSSILKRVRESFHVEDMKEIRRDQTGNVLRILLGN